MYKLPYTVSGLCDVICKDKVKRGNSTVRCIWHVTLGAHAVPGSATGKAGVSSGFLNHTLVKVFCCCCWLFLFVLFCLVVYTSESWLFII